MPILNYTTTIPTEKTAGEIISRLALKGARRVTQEFDSKGSIIGISFSFGVAGVPVYFKLPAHEAGVESYMLNERKSRKSYKGYLNDTDKAAIKQQARCTAWRILKDWIEAQIALVESQQAEMGQVFMPYAQDTQGQTMYQLFVESNRKHLGAGGCVMANKGELDKSFELFMLYVHGRRDLPDDMTGALKDAFFAGALAVFYGAMNPVDEIRFYADELRARKEAGEANHG